MAIFIHHRGSHTSSSNAPEGGYESSTECSSGSTDTLDPHAGHRRTSSPTHDARGATLPQRGSQPRKDDPVYEAQWVNFATSFCVDSGFRFSKELWFRDVRSSVLRYVVHPPHYQSSYGALHATPFSESTGFNLQCQSSYGRGREAVIPPYSLTCFRHGLSFVLCLLCQDIKLTSRTLSPRVRWCCGGFRHGNGGGKQH